MMDIAGNSIESATADLQQAAYSGWPTQSAQTARPRLADFRFTFNARQISPDVVTGIARGVEFLIITLTGYLFFQIYVNTSGLVPQGTYIAATVFAGAATVLAYSSLGLYRSSSLANNWLRVSRVWLGWTVALAMLVALIFLFKVGLDFSRVWLATWYVAAGSLMVVNRLAMTQMMRQWVQQGRMVRRAVIVGSGESTEELIKALESEQDSDVRICGLFDDRGRDRVSTAVAGYPVLGNLDELIEFSRKTRVDMLIVSLPMSAEKRLLQILKKLWVMPVDIRLSAFTSSLRFRPRAYSYIGSIPLIDLADRPLADWERVQKWLFDKVIGTAALIALSPLMLMTAIAIKLDSKGPVLFRQKRYGFNNELVEVFKFRSMYTDKSDANAVRLVTKGDPRVTRVGRFIRKTSLDELPQLFNVLAGSLSLVGPRPHALQAKAAEQLYQDVVDGYFARHKVRPGLTGWAQINGWRGETDTEEKIKKRVEHDLYYIEHWSVFLDLYILVMTPFALLNSENAY